MPGVALTLVLLASGAAALLHESAWFRLLTPLLGAGALPAAAVAAGALLGMAIGARLGGRLADRTGRPFAVLVAAEVVAAVLGYLVPPALDGIAVRAEGPAAWAMATALLAVVAVPWGASVPAALRALAPDPASTGRAFKGLYAWNTLGAVTGIVVGATFAFEALGNRGAVHVASLLQLGAALVAFSLAMQAKRPPRTPTPPRSPRSYVPKVPCPCSWPRRLPAPSAWSCKSPGCDASRHTSARPTPSSRRCWACTWSASPSVPGCSDRAPPARRAARSSS